MIKDFASYIFTGDKSKCTGCGACTQVCKHNALTMVQDSEGFLYPDIDADRCIKCGLCELTCPVVGKETANQTDAGYCYIGTTNEEKYYKESASIGVCTMLSDLIVQQGGIVYGCYLDEDDWTTYHIGVSDLDGVQQIRNSKYLQSNTKYTYTETKNNLLEGKLVLYIGTPCQIAGLKGYLKKDYPNLYTIDIICHGTFSPKLMPLEVSYWETLLGGRIKNFRFRSKRVFKHINGGMVNFDLVKPNGKIKHIERHATSSPSYRCYAYAGDGKNYNLRLSCYSCPFRANNRYADISVGDPWFIDPLKIKNKELSPSNVIRSLFSSNTNKGEKLLSQIFSNLTIEKFDREESFVQPAVKPSDRQIPNERDLIYSNLNDKTDYASLVESVLNCNLKKAHEDFLFTYVKHRIKSIINKFL